MAEPLLTLHQVHKQYQDRLSDQWVQAVDGVSLTIQEHEMIGIIGESGCGKSTLMKLLVGLESRSSGEIYFKGRSIDEWMKQKSRQFRRMIQIIYQNPYEVFDPRQTVGDILLQPLKIHRIGKTRTDRVRRLVHGLEIVGFAEPETFLGRHPHELSGGQLQRIAILRSLLVQPEIMIADEPVSMLDMSIRREVLTLLERSHRETKNTMIIVSHDILTLRQMVQKIIVMNQGRILEIIPTQHRLNDAMHPYTQSLIDNAHAKEVNGLKRQKATEAYRQLSQRQLQHQLTEVAENHWVVVEA